MSAQLWPTPAQMAVITPHLPVPRGRLRVDDRRVLCGICHVLKSGLQWQHAPGD